MLTFIRLPQYAGLNKVVTKAAIDMPLGVSIYQWKISQFIDIFIVFRKMFTKHLL